MIDWYVNHRDVFNQALTVFVFCVGVFAFGRAVAWWRWFAGDQSNVAIAFQGSMREQCIGSGGTLIFTVTATISAVTGAELAMWNSLPPEIASAIRLAMYSAVISATDSLGYAVDEIVKRPQQLNSDDLRELAFSSPEHRRMILEIVHDLERAGDDNHD